MSNVPSFPVLMYRKAAKWASHVRLTRKLAYFVSICSLITGFLTYRTFKKASFYAADNKQIFILLAIDLVLLLTISVIITKSVVKLWEERKKKLAGYRLHTRFSLLFAFLAVTPTIIVAVFSIFFFNLGIQSWFDDRVKMALNESVSVAQAYLKEHQKAIASDTRALADEIAVNHAADINRPQLLESALKRLASLRDVSEALIFDDNHKVIARYGFTYSLEFEEVPTWAREMAHNGEVAIVANKKQDRVRALALISDSAPVMFLYTGRPVAPKVLEHIRKTEGAVGQYRVLELDRSQFEVMFIVIFGVLALMLLMIAVWLGLSFATQLSYPIANLINAAERVSAGDLTARVADPVDEMDFAPLSRSFNNMTEQLQENQKKLLKANRQIDRRRLFMEAVLSGVSSGVIGLSDNKIIKFPNQISSELLGVNLKKLIGNPFNDAMPEAGHLLDAAEENPGQVVQEEITLTHFGYTKTFLMRIVSQVENEKITGYVVTFDDVSDLVAAQRKAAWSDVARRIAHEIKNPLTPIQLSAERLKRKYLAQIATDEDIFNRCIDTIVRQVGVISSMVDEFSQFARMPQPEMAYENMTTLIKEVVCLQEQAHPEIVYKLDMPENLFLMCDGYQVSQCLTNILTNAKNAIDAKPTLKSKKIDIVVITEENSVTISILDNGIGLPKENREMLTEPYITMREKGTGLGLAIVKKIMLDHDGFLTLEDAVPEGAKISLVFKRVPMQELKKASK